jgi:hypothetical protein
MGVGFALALLTNCKGPPECGNNGDCSGLQACIAERCVEVNCLDSSRCAIEAYCETETYTCEPGCLTNDDCYAADRCDPTTRTCEPRGCADTALDCQPFERCNTMTAQCEEDPLPHCQPCASDATCQGGECQYIAGGRYCLMECNPEAADPCPAGFQCTGPEPYQCVANCTALNALPQ